MIDVYKRQAQNNEGQDKVIDLGTQTTTELRKTQAVSTIYSDELDKNATTSPYNAIYGLLPGLSVMQNTSWGTDKSRLNVQMCIRDRMISLR